MLRRTLITGLCAAGLAPGADPPHRELWRAIESIYAATLRHPFLEGLTTGTLAESRFHFYLKQDVLYLRAFADALRTLARKAPRAEWAATLRKHAGEAIDAEMALHSSLLRGASPAEAAPVNYAYINHFRIATAHGTFAEGLSAMLPCYWIYLEVGRELARKGSPNPGYQKWIDNYAGEDYAKSVRQVLAMYDAVAPKLPAEERKRCLDLFVRSARYEYLFWDMAWREEQWQP